MHDPYRNEAWRTTSMMPSTGMVLSSKIWDLLSESWRLSSTMSTGTSTSSAVTMKPYSTSRWSWRWRLEHIMESWMERKADSTLQRKAHFQSVYYRGTQVSSSFLKSLKFLESLPSFSFCDPRLISQIITMFFYTAGSPVVLQSLRDELIPHLSHLDHKAVHRLKVLFPSTEYSSQMIWLYCE